ncbi:MAG: hypothetical protein QOE45_1553 [Frankiaceae bacterium]|nr:hypothetical protein [Frankiaceae bacterium]
MLSLTFALVVAAAPVAAAYPADATVALPLSTVVDMAVDSVHGHVFFTGGDATTVVVRNLDGSPATTIDVAGARTLALAPDSSTLYVSVRTAIVAIDTTTLTETARWAAADSTCVGDIAAFSTSVWFVYGCDSETALLGVLDLAADPPAFGYDQLGQVYYRLQFAAVADHLLVEDMIECCGGATLRSFPVTGATLGTPATRTLTEHGPMVGDGSDVVVTGGIRGCFPRYRIGDLSSDGVFGTCTMSIETRSVAASGGFVATGTYESPSSLVKVYRGDGVLFHTYTVAGELRLTGFTSDLSRFYVVAEGRPNYLRILYGPTRNPTALSFTKPSSAHITAAFTVKGVLSSTITVPAGTVLHVTRKSPYDTVRLPDVTSGSGGTFAITNKVWRRGAYTYTFSFDGDATFRPTAKAVGVYVVGLVPTLDIRTNATTYAYHATATVTGHLGKTHTVRTLRLSGWRYAFAPVELRTAPVNGSGYLSATFQMESRTTFSAYFPGDDVYEPRTVSRTTYVRVAVAQALSGYYTTSGSYRVFHASKNPVVTITVTPDVSVTCMYVTTERYYSSAWHVVATTGCTALSRGYASVTLGGSHPTGYPFRVRSTFAGSPYYVQTVSAWAYYRFTT